MYSTVSPIDWRGGMQQANTPRGLHSLEPALLAQRWLSPPASPLSTHSGANASDATSRRPHGQGNHAAHVVTQADAPGTQRASVYRGEGSQAANG